MGLKLKSKEKEGLKRVTKKFMELKPIMEERFGISLDDIVLKVEDMEDGANYRDGTITVQEKEASDSPDFRISANLIHETAHHWREIFAPWKVNSESNLFYKTLNEGFARYVENDFFPEITKTKELTDNFTEMVRSSFKFVNSKKRKPEDYEKMMFYIGSERVGAFILYKQPAVLEDQFAEKTNLDNLLSRTRYEAGYAFFKWVSVCLGEDKIFEIMKDPESVSYTELLSPLHYVMRMKSDESSEAWKNIKHLEEKTLNLLKNRKKEVRRDLYRKIAIDFQSMTAQFPAAANAFYAAYADHYLLSLSIEILFCFPALKISHNNPASLDYYNKNKEANELIKTIKQYSLTNPAKLFTPQNLLSLQMAYARINEMRMK